MKKLLLVLCAICIAIGTTVSAATNSDTTYTEKFIKKHTQKVVDKEKALTKKANDAKAKKDAQKAALKKEKEALKKRQQAQRDALKKKQAEQNAKLQKKKDAINTLKSW